MNRVYIIIASIISSLFPFKFRIQIYLLAFYWKQEIIFYMWEDSLDLELAKILWKFQT